MCRYYSRYPWWRICLRCTTARHDFARGLCSQRWRLSRKLWCVRWLGLFWLLCWAPTRGCGSIKRIKVVRHKSSRITANITHRKWMRVWPTNQNTLCQTGIFIIHHISHHGRLQLLLLLLILLQLSQLLYRVITLDGGHRVDRSRRCGHFHSVLVQKGDVIISLDNNHDLQRRREVDEERD